jgi:hypothetical protein
MSNKDKRYTLILTTGLMVLGLSLAVAAQLGSNGVWSLAADEPLIIGDYADAFQYDGGEVRVLDGSAELDVDVLADDGLLTVDLETTEESGALQVGDEIFLEGAIRLVMDEFEGEEPFHSGGIAESLRVHGDTGRMSSVMPEMFAHVLGWGLIDIYVDGELVFENLDGHFMLSESVRRSETDGYQVLRASDKAIYDPSLEDKTGFAYSQELELHVWASSSSESLGVAEGEEIFLHLNLAVDGTLEVVDITSEPPPEEPEDPEEPNNGGPKGNNGIGNGIDPQPPGNPPVNDGEDSKPGRGKK